MINNKPTIPFPSPHDRSPNAPAIIIDGPTQCKLYNARCNERGKTPDKLVHKANEDVRSWMQSMANTHGWMTCSFHGQQCLLVADVQINRRGR